MKKQKQDIESGAFYRRFLKLPLSSKVKYDFLQIRFHARNKRHGCFARYETIAEELGLSRWEVTRAMAQLKAVGLVQSADDASRKNPLWRVADLGEWISVHQNDTFPPTRGSYQRRTQKKPPNSVDVGHKRTKDTGHKRTMEASDSEHKRTNDVAVAHYKNGPDLITLKDPFKTEREQTHESNGRSTALVCVSPPPFLPVLKPPPKPELPDREKFEKLMGLFVALGKGMSPVDYRNCENFWRHLAPEERNRAHESAFAQLREWQTRPTEKIPQPWNYLGGKYWTRNISRIMPQRKPPSKAEIGFEAARKALIAEGLFG